jgi:flagellar biosynthesis protein FlhB
MGLGQRAGPAGTGQRAEGDAMSTQLAAGSVLLDGFSSVLTWFYLALLVFKVYVFLDAAFRRDAAYRAVDKQTKAFWLVVLGFAVVVGFLPVPLLGQMLNLVGLVAAIVYMVDVRPRVKAISPARGKKSFGGKKSFKGRNDDRNHMGPYGPW